MKFIRVILSVVMGALLFPINAYSAQESGVSLTVSPEYERKFGFYRMETVPGDSKEFEFHVKNVSDTNREVWVYVSDQLTAVNGGKRYISHEQENTLVGTWTDFEPRKIELVPGQEYSGKVRINVPEDIVPGQYISAIVVSEKLETLVQTRGDLTLNIPRVHLIAKQIVLDYKIQDSSHKLNILGVTKENTVDGFTSFTFQVENAGTILEKSLAYLELFTLDGERIGAHNLTTDSLYAKDTFDIFFKHDTFMYEGQYKGIFTMNYFEGLQEVFEFGFEVTAREVEENISAREERGTIETVSKGTGIASSVIYGAAGALGLTGFFVIIVVVWKRRKEREEVEERFGNINLR